jgi:ribonucleoside-diphosphate reductase alpha chain
MGATHAEKSTSKTGALNAVSADMPTAASASQAEADGPACMMRPGDPGFDECEACQ